MEKIENQFRRVDELLQPYAVFDEFVPKNNVHLTTSVDLLGNPSSDHLELYFYDSSSAAYFFKGWLPDLTQSEYEYILHWYAHLFDVTYSIGFQEPDSLRAVRSSAHKQF